MSVATDAEAIMKALKPFLPRLRRVGHEAGALSPWLHPELASLVKLTPKPSATS
jgi:transposase